MSGNGWVRLRPSAETVDRAKREMEADRSSEGGPGLFDGDGWPGNLGEQALTVWLVRQGINASRRGGVNDAPDVIANGASVGVKTRKLFDPLWLIVPEKHVAKPWDWWFFCAWDGAVLHLVGAMATPSFREVAERRDTFAGKSVPCRFIYANDPRLLTPTAFLASLRSAA